MYEYSIESTDASYDTQDGIFDLAWSETHENQIASACGDGSIKLWDIALDVCCKRLRMLIAESPDTRLEGTHPRGLLA